ncbi:methyltetrahydrofolate cobalamin methyltransferase [Desulfosporosinus nitroreducens]|uniref:Methyltetrahydrofolate cobalamin methyltransferase n=1 Tax=Desulfosporosinus nitroreducens TaxID=2018668 RepID=A0ABT8QPK4_9FIRM|nr:methyltetrahydrofolate cobalamin methyltransferase [Desulfosporosinus nitroreducens]MCO1601361.1 methyltetrahydrofolate cobalamin methyltransferase [Desulfosporosinus nitroreducens]MDO0821851.1 methyltetrahydrofolate cobalamin methyltransferase [Desulfosporosinus nitroreducens]
MIIIGEKINGAIPSVAKAIVAKDEDLIRKLAKDQSEAGAAFIDVCASVENSIELETIKWLIDLVQEVTDTPIAIDSPNVRICAEAIKFCKKPGLINSVSLEGDKIDVIFPLIAETKWECVALLCDDTGIPQDSEKRLEVFAGIMKKAKEYNIDPSRLHIDPLVQMLCTSEDGINTVVEVIKEIKTQYPEIHVTGGASNISFNLPVRKLVNQAFLVLAMNAGMDSAIIDPLNRDMMGMLYATEALLGQDEYCMEYIGAYREDKFGQKK